MLGLGPLAARLELPAAGPPHALMQPIVILPDDLDDALEECHDMLCPITHALLVEPVYLHGKV